MKLYVRRVFAVLVFFIALLHGAGVSAHVKWFFPYDLSNPPLSVDKVFNSAFITLYIISIFFIYFFFWLDRYLYRKNFLAEKLKVLTISQESAFWIMRGASSFVFLALFIYGLVDKSVYLTPELHTDLAIVKWIHLVMAISVWYRPTIPLVGIGIFVLFGMGIIQYGLFHMLDYLIFVGIGVYFTLSFLSGVWIKFRYVTLFAATGITLLWASVEKWGYPGWTYPLLRKDPSILMGLNPEFYMLFAGFIEFNITFIILSSVSSFSRFTALGLNGVFILAIFKFGLIDAVGHLMIIAVLLILAARGPTSARYFLVLPDKSLWTEAYFMTGLYILALNIIFLAYYGLYFLLY